MLFWRKIFVQWHLVRDGSHPSEKGAHTQVHRKVWTPRHTCRGSRTFRPNRPINGCHTIDRRIQIWSMESCVFAPWKICCCQVPRRKSGGGSETATVRMPSFETARKNRATQTVGVVSSTPMDPVPLTVPDSVDSPCPRRWRVP